MTANRFKRPHLDRDRPNRTWATLFQAPANGKTPVTGHPGSTDTAAEAPPVNGSPFPEGASMAAPLADVVERGYRVINEYLRQGQSVAEGFSPRVSSGPRQNGGQEDVQQLAQRVMQYGWDFAGLWFEMWSKMAASSGVVTPPPAEASQSSPPPEAPAAGRARSNGAKHEDASRPLRVTVSVECARRTTTSIDLRPGPPSRLVIHALRAEGTEAPPIRNVVLESPLADDALTVNVVVGADQPSGIYNGLILDASSNLPRGTLSLVIHGDQQR